MPVPLAALGTARLLRVPRAVPGARRLARDALHRRRVRGRAPSRRPAPGRSPNGCAASCSPASRGCRSATRRSCARARRRSPGYAPLGGVFLVTLAGGARRGRRRRRRSPRSPRVRARRVGGAAAIAVLVRRRRRARRRLEWTHGRPRRSRSRSCRATSRRTSSSTRGSARTTFELYAELVARSRGRLVVLPESAFPLFADEVPDSGAAAPAAHGRRAQRRRPRRPVHRRAAAARRRAALLQQRRERSARPTCSSTASGTSCRSARRFRSSRSLGWFIRNVLSIPLADQTAGAAVQPPLAVAGQRVAVNICYEDAFGADIRAPGARPRRCSSTSPTTRGTAARSPRCSTTRSPRCARSRPAARCCARPTPASRRRIDHDGRELARLPWFTRGILEVEITGRTGVTPYVRFGDAAGGARRGAARRRRRARRSARRAPRGRVAVAQASGAILPAADTGPARAAAAESGRLR